MRTARLEWRPWRVARRRGIAIVTLASLSVVIPEPRLCAQQGQVETQRKAVEKPAPRYPEMARAMKLSGSTVRVAIKIAPNGKVVSAEVLGGHPIFAQAAVESVRQWRFEPGPQQTEEVVSIIFRP